jgi:hypothetical protein
MHSKDDITDEYIEKIRSDAQAALCKSIAIPRNEYYFHTKIK